MGKFVAKIVESAVGALVGGVVSSVLGGGGKGGGEAPAIPAPKEPAVAPVPDDDAARRAERRRLAEIRARSGRASTILSNIADGDKLGA